MREKYNKNACAKRTSSHKGRNKNLILLRNEKLLLRFYQLSEVDRKRLDDVLNDLSTKEFFISQTRVWRIIKQNLPLLSKIKEQCLNASLNSDKSQLNLFD